MRPIRFAMRLARASALVVPLTFAMGAASAQSPARRPVRVAVPNEFPSADARALIVRFASAEKGDVIVLKETDVTPETFVAAVALLHHLRKSSAAPQYDEVITVQAFAPVGRGGDARLKARLAGVLAQLRAQPLARIGNLGQGRWIEVPEVALART
jgi:hypothetical protein